ncbi:hypothetical protein SISNIDRAFT_468328 [Sistotremastrum niveocremeum HHB9708]|uniref:Uncharacterized protein n=1 Tax=Sistotremastrum niveocremeum HHB9708 TaxID=1314777 RepID=A0A164RRZ7_9AGAM|nr:hypothetical protein SISNIDRAFT_468328 [Sistotremastrum niveocremeum HHB9708]
MSVTAVKPFQLPLHQLRFELIETGALFEPLPFRELMILSSFSPVLKQSIQVFLLRRFRQTFEALIPQFEAFRVFWRTQNILLSGSAVLHFITQDTSWSPHDLDFVVGRNCVEPLLLQLQLRGYVRHILEMDIKGSSHKPTKIPGQPPSQIDVVESTMRDPLQTIMFFHSTQVMNFITADSLTILYPDLTLEHVGIARDSDFDVTHLVEKYRARGFDVFYSASDFRTTYSACPLLMRGVGDSQTLYYEFQGTSSNTHALLYPSMVDAVWHFWQVYECSYPFCRNCCYRDEWRREHQHLVYHRVDNTIQFVADADAPVLE